MNLFKKIIIIILLALPMTLVCMEAAPIIISNTSEDEIKTVLRTCHLRSSKNGYEKFKTVIKNTETDELYGTVEYAIPAGKHNPDFHATIDRLYVVRAYRRNKYGSVLLEDALKKIKDNHYTKVNLLAEPTDLHSGQTYQTMLAKLVAFYERHGAKMTKMFDTCAEMSFNLCEISKPDTSASH